MKIKTSELSGPALTWAVAKCLGKDVSVVVNEGTPEVWFNHDINHSITYKNRKGEDRFILNGKPVGLFGNPMEYRWEHVGEIIEREKIDTRWTGENWIAGKLVKWVTGPTLLIAAMRCYVASKLGEEVEVPEELLK